MDEPLQEVFFCASEAKRERLKRFTINVEDQEDFESEKLWSKVSEAIRMQDQVGQIILRSLSYVNDDFLQSC